MVRASITAILALSPDFPARKCCLPILIATHELDDPISDDDIALSEFHSEMVAAKMPELIRMDPRAIRAEAERPRPGEGGEQEERKHRAATLESLRDGGGMIAQFVKHLTSIGFGLG